MVRPNGARAEQMQKRCGESKPLTHANASVPGDRNKQTFKVSYMPVESSKQKEASFSTFINLLIRYALFALLLFLVAIGVGAPGYSYIADLHWPENLPRASMMVTGMGPASGIKAEGAKSVPSLCVLYTGIAFLSLSAVLSAPILHRFFHKFLVDEE